MKKTLASVAAIAFSAMAMSAPPVNAAGQSCQNPRDVSFTTSGEMMTFPEDPATYDYHGGDIYVVTRGVLDKETNPLGLTVTVKKEALDRAKEDKSVKWIYVRMDGGKNEGVPHLSLNVPFTIAARSAEADRVLSDDLVTITTPCLTRQAQIEIQQQGGFAFRYRP